MPTTIAKRTPQVVAHDVTEPLIPLPSNKLRRRFLGALIVWQVAIFWIYPIYLAAFRGGTFPDIFDWQAVQRYRAFEFAPLRVEFTFGIALALSANVAFALAKSPFRNGLGIVGIYTVYVAALLGALSSYGADDSFTSLLFLPIASLTSLVAAYIFWRWAPGGGNRQLLHLQETSTPTQAWKPQFRLLHLFYLMSGVAILLAMARSVPTYFNLDELFHEPIDKMLILILIFLITTFFAWITFTLALTPGRKFLWLLLTPILVDVIAFAFTILNSGITGKPSSWQAYLSTLCIFAAEFAFLAGTALALRLLGYRLVRSEGIKLSVLAQRAVE